MYVPNTLSQVMKKGCEKLNLVPRSWWCTLWDTVLFQKKRWNRFHGSITPQWSSTAFMVPMQKKKVETRGDHREQAADGVEQEAIDGVDVEGSRWCHEWMCRCRNRLMCMYRCHPYCQMSITVMATKNGHAIKPHQAPRPALV